MVDHSVLPSSDPSALSFLDKSHSSVIVDAPQWNQKVPDLEKQVDMILRKMLAVLIKEGNAPLLFQGITILFTTDEELQQLNKQFCQKDYPTNVLSFPTYSREELQFSSFQRDFLELTLGDMALAYGVVERESVEQGKSFEDHMTHLIIHGVLHLLGYDHMVEEEREKMESLEIKILHTLVISNPYEER